MWLVTAAQVKLQMRGGRILHRWKHLDQGVAKIAGVRIGELSPALTQRAKGSKLRGAEHLALGSETWKAGSSSPCPGSSLHGHLLRMQVGHTPRYRIETDCSISTWSTRITITGIILISL